MVNLTDGKKVFCDSKKKRKKKESLLIVQTFSQRECVRVQYNWIIGHLNGLLHSWTYKASLFIPNS